MKRPTLHVGKFSVRTFYIAIKRYQLLRSLVCFRFNYNVRRRAVHFGLFKTSLLLLETAWRAVLKVVLNRSYRYSTLNLCKEFCINCEPAVCLAYGWEWFFANILQ